MAVFIRQYAAFILFIPLLLSARPAAAEPVPGNSCAGLPAHAFQWAGGPENGGATDGMFCESNTWKGIINFQAGGNVGIGTASPAGSLDVISMLSPAFPAPWGIVSDQFSTDNYSATFMGRKARGTAAAPTAVVTGDFGGILSTSFYDGSGYNLAGWAGFVANGTIATGSVPTDFIVYTGSTNANPAERMRVLSSGNVGIGTTTPQATLDINGYLRLAKNSAQPAACSATNDGALALSHVYTLCICKGGSTSWVQSKDGTTACSW